MLKKSKKGGETGIMHGFGLFAADSTVGGIWQRQLRGPVRNTEGRLGVSKNKRLVVVISRRYRGFGIGYINES